ncbi:MAG: hypothetical protein WEB06_00375 [Actinomycetota bacterium]
MSALLIACGGSSALTAKNLARIMPSATDAPPGTQIDAESLGPKVELEEFVTDIEVRIRLSQLGFKIGWITSFATANYVPDKDKAPVGSAFYGTFAVILRDEKAAADGFDFYVQRLKDRAQDFTPLVMQDLGEEVFSFRFSTLDDTPLPGLAILWRVKNGLFSLVGVGNPAPDPKVARGLAAKIAARAEKAG